MFCIWIINDCPKPISFIPNIIYLDKNTGVLYMHYQWLFQAYIVNTLYHIIRLKYRCFVYALSMIVPSLYRVYPISHTLYRIPYIVYPENFKIFLNFIKKKISKIQNKKFQIFQNFKIFQNFITFLNFSKMFQNF